MIDEDHIRYNYKCPKCGKVLPLIGCIKPRSPIFCCPQCGNEGTLEGSFLIIMATVDADKLTEYLTDMIEYLSSIQ